MLIEQHGKFQKEGGSVQCGSTLEETLQLANSHYAASGPEERSVQMAKSNTEWKWKF